MRIQIARDISAGMVGKAVLQTHTHTHTYMHTCMHILDMNFGGGSG